MINIKELIPFMKDGWVAMDKSGEWWWYSEKPSPYGIQWHVQDGKTGMVDNDVFDIAPADDWEKSLIKIDNKAREKFEEEYQNNIQKTIQELKQDD